MGSKSTDDLRQELMTQSSIDSYIEENRPYFADRSVTELLTVLFREKSMSKAELGRQAAMSEVYLHQVFSGRRKPSRDRLLCICIGMGATREETQRLLEQAPYAQLYPRIKREAILYHGIVHHTPLSEINETLFAATEKTLF